jgi:Asp-tRNA(Asn)/Glu-tRNA(Gln) amidotransferase A subunit family amidase
MKRILCSLLVATLPFGSVLADAPKSKNAKVTLVYQHELPNVPGKSIKGVLVEYGPGGYSPGHTHPKSAFIYATVLEGAIRSQVNDGPVTTYEAGQSFSELPGDRHSVSANANASNAALLESRADDLTDYARLCLEYGATVTGADYARALGQVDLLKQYFADKFDEYDLILSPTMAVPAFPVGESPAEIDGKTVHGLWGYLPFTYPINLIGHPAASIPCGFSSDGLPIGLHLIGNRGDEETVIAVSAAFEQAQPWIDKRPLVS